MTGFRCLLVMVVCCALVMDSAEAGWFRKAIRKIGNGLKKVGKAIKKPLCKVAFGIACPAAVTAAGGLVAGSTGGAGSALATVGVALGNNWCKTKKESCKRSVGQDLAGYVTVPFSHRFSDYDTNGDKQIRYEEFVYSVMRSLPLFDPEDLREPFKAADADKNNVLEEDEFMGAPFIFDDLLNVREQTAKGNTTEPAV